MTDGVLAAPDCQKCRFIQQIGQVGSDEPGGHGCDGFQVCRIPERDAAGMHLQNGKPSDLVRPVHQDLAIKSPGPQ